MYQDYLINIVTFIMEYDILILNHWFKSIK